MSSCPCLSLSVSDSLIDLLKTMSDNITHLLSRGEKVELMVERTAQLEVSVSSEATTHCLSQCLILASLLIIFHPYKYLRNLSFLDSHSFYSFVG